MRAKGWFRGFVILAVVAVCFLPAIGAWAAEQNLRDISTKELKSMLDQGENFTMVNVLPRIIHDARYIAGSINIPIGKVKTSPEMLKDKTKPIVFYCLGRG